VVVCNVKNIGIYKDAGQRNDLLVKGKLITKDIAGNRSISTTVTDTHKFAHKDATFNWRWKFPITCPIGAASLMLSLIDEDALSADDPIYKGKEIPLDHLIRLAYQKWLTDPFAVLGQSTKVVLFNEHGDGDTSLPRKCCLPFCCMCKCCKKCSKKQHPSEARLTLELQCIPRSYAEKNPAGEGREGPDALPAPTDRVDWSTFLSAPMKMVKVLLGPDQYRACGWICCCTVCVLIILLVLVGFFLLTNTFPVFKVN